MTRRLRVLAPALVAGLLSLVSCATVRRPTSLAVAQEISQRGAATEYRFQVGDELEIRVLNNPDATADVNVRPDGKIRLLWIGDLAAAGRTVNELSADLAVRYKRLPLEVAVNVKTFALQRVFVGGQVGHPGMVPLSGPLTVLQAVFSAEGFKDDACTSEVVVIRRDATVAPPHDVVFMVNLDRVVNGTDPAQDLLLQPADIVVVPRSGIGNVNLWVDQYVRKVLPFSLSANYTVYYGNHVLP
jgi:polysaccharide biosynthesis/export protein